MMRADLRYALRSLQRAPGFAAAAIVTLALGVGVNSGILSLINGVLFRDIPAPRSHELVSIYETFQDVPGMAGIAMPAELTTTQYETIRDRATTLAGLLAHSEPTGALLGGDAQRQMGGLLVTCNYFDVLEQPPALGRALAGADCRLGADPVLVLGHDEWTRTFAADPTVVGRTIELNQRFFTVIGVARDGTFGGRFVPEFFIPISAEPLLSGEGQYADEQSGWLTVIGRRAAGVGLAQARAEPETLPPFVRGAAIGGAAVIMTAFLLILLIACANVANLMLARGMARSREFAVRLSLGASRAHVVRQLLVESLLLAAAGGVLGSLLAFWSFDALMKLAMPTLLPVGLPLLAIDSTPDLRVLGAALALTIGTGVVFGLAPALRASRTDLGAVMKQDSAGAVGARGSRRLQGILLGTQVALCMVLIIGAGLLLRGLSAALTIDPGFDSREVTVLSYDYTDDTGHDDDPAFWQRLREEIVALPGVEAAAYAARDPLGSDFGYTGVRLPSQGENELSFAVFNPVSPEYFATVGLEVVRGRTFADTDFGAGIRSAIVSESTARNLWGNEDPVGRTLLQRAGENFAEVELQVVGVVADAQLSTLGEVDPYYAYVPTRRADKLLVRSALDYPTTAAAIRGVVRRIDPALPAPLYSLEANLDRWRGIAGIATTLAGALGGLALVLAAVGIYGVVSYFVARRFREIGVRLALGAQAASIYRLVLSRTLRPVAVGAAIGIAAAVAASGILSSMLFGVSPLDPVGLGGAAVFVLGVALAAGFWAAGRASRVDAVVTLRHE